MVRTRSRYYISVAALNLLATAAVFGQDVHLAYKRFTLSDGLTVVVHEDHKAPIASINVTYHVGSKDERPGKTGFAHLFEHLMFSGSEHLQGSYVDAMERIGGTSLNGTTNQDCTNFFETVPSSAIEFALFAESDRMGHLGVTQATLDLQRGVVQNEKRQREGQPYALADELLLKSVYPAAHPYAHAPIGSMADLNAASLADVKEWFKTYYGPSNATLTIAGDVTSEQVKTLAEKYFGAIPPGPPVAHQQLWIAKMTGTHAEVAQDRVPQPQLRFVWNVPGYGEADSDLLDLVASVLSTGKSSRLYKRLVYDDQAVTNVTAHNETSAIGGQFTITILAKPDADLNAVRKAVAEEMNKLLSNGPTIEELQRAKTSYEAGVLRSLDRVVQQANTLAEGQTFRGDPDQYEVSLNRIRNATSVNLEEAANHWLSDGMYELTIQPFPAFKASHGDIDRTSAPSIVQSLSPQLPVLQRFTLSNGLSVVLAERHELPLVEFAVQIDAGFAADRAFAPGTAQLTAALLTGGTDKYTALQTSDLVQKLGATLNATARVDTTVLQMSALRANLDPSLNLFADVLMHPNFLQADFERQQKQQLSRIAQEETIPVAEAIRLLPPKLFGPEHPYGMPLTGSGTTSGVSHLTRTDLLRFHATWFKPNNATLIVVGDATREALKPKLEQVFAAWKAGPLPPNKIPQVKPVSAPQVYLIDKPGAQQSTIITGVIAPAQNSPEGVALLAWNDVLGGTFGGRLNMNLRETKHWSYGVRSSFVGTGNQRPFIVLAPVQTDKTVEAMGELKKELQAVVRDHLPTEAELQAAVAHETLSLPGSLESMSSVLFAIENLLAYKLPDNYYSTLGARINALSIRDLESAGQSFLRPDAAAWIIVGDRTKIEAGVRELNYGAFHVIGSNGVETK